MPHELPLQQWRLRNFKSVREAIVDFAPLTVLVGPNSSGKSSLIQSILLFSQGSRSWMSEGGLPVNGSLVGLGDFERILSWDAEERIIGVGAVVNLATPVGDARMPPEPRLRRTGVGHRGTRGSVDWAVELSADDSDRDHGTVSVTSVEVAGARSLRLSVRHSSDARVPRLRGALGVGIEDIPVAAVRHKAGVPTQLYGERSGSDFEAQRFLVLFREVVDQMMAEMEESEADLPLTVRALRSIEDPVGIEELMVEVELEDETDQIPDLVAPRFWLDTGPWSSRHLDVSRILPMKRLADLFSASISRKGTASSEPLDFSSVLRGLDEDAVMSLSVLLRDRRWSLSLANELAKNARVLPGHAQRVVLRPIQDRNAGELLESCRALLWFFQKQIRYLGPLRERPDMMYRVAETEESDDIGTRGQYSASVFFRHGRDVVISPPFPPGVDETDRARRRTLQQSVTSWLDYLGLATGVRSRNRGSLGIELQVKVGAHNASVDVTSVGVGLSQVLPVVLRVLMSDPGDVVFLEQPELHLHPALQQRLAEFLLAAVQTGRQVVVETHSDHLVTRLRRRIAEGSDEVASLVKVLNVSLVEGATRYEAVDINEFGGIDEWPPGFFDQGVEDVRQIVQAGLEKKRRRTNPESH